MTGPQDTCTITDCNRPHEARGWCSMHYSRWRRRGDAAWEPPTRCSIQGCEAPHKCRGFCERHYYSEYTCGRECATAGCERRSRAYGLCSMHYQRYRAEVAPACSIEGCGKPAQSRGWCRKHYARWRNGTDLDDPRDLRFVSRTPVAPCSNDGCEELAALKGQCKKHYTQRKNREYREANAHKFRDWHLARYGITSADYDKLFESQGGRCASCGEHASEDRKLCVDHDHECCPGEQQNACGRCVRGLLCLKCNAGLGNFNDDPDKLRKAIEYLARTRGQLFS